MNINIDLVKALEVGIANEDIIKINKPIGDWVEQVLHVSDLAYSVELCPRQLWLRLKGYDKAPLTPGKIWMHRNGHAIHARVIELWRIGLPKLYQGEWDIDKEEEATIIEDIHGTADVILKDSIDNKILVDIKTIRGNKFNYLQEPDPKNVIQLQGYMKGFNIDNGMLFYIDREGQNFAKQFPVERDDNKITEGIKVIKSIMAMLGPPPIMKVGLKYKENKSSTSVTLDYPWQCQWCDYLDISCSGANNLPSKYREYTRVIGHLKEGKVKLVDGVEDLQPYLEGLS